MNPQHQEELNQRLHELDASETASDEDEEVDPISAPKNERPFSILETLGILMLTEMMRQSILILTDKTFPGVFSRFGSGIFADAPVALFVYIYCRRKIGDKVDDFFGIKWVADRSLFLWLIAASLYELGFIYFLDRNPDLFPRYHGQPMFLPVSLLLAPVFEELLYRGFVLQSLRSTTGTGPALVLSSVLFGFMHYQYPWPYRIAIMGSGLLAGIARVRTESIIAPIGMHIVINLIAYGVHFH
ncbi:MAG: CPBP family intramembrane glutamic endopeptidase [Bdellovibrionales bacterium]